MARCQLVPKNAHATVLLQKPRDCIRVPACPRKSLHNRVAAAVQGLWQITTHSWHQALLHARFLVPTPANMAVLLGPLETFSLASLHSIYQSLPSKRTASPHVARRPLRPCCLLLGIFPSHQTTARYQAAEFLTLCSPVYRVLMVLKHSPFSFLPFLFRPFWVFPFFLSSCFSGECFPCTLLPVFVLSPQTKTAPYPRGFCLPHFTSLCHIPANFCGSSYADYCVNQINFIDGKNGLLLI